MAASLQRDEILIAIECELLSPEPDAAASDVLHATAWSCLVSWLVIKVQPLALDPSITVEPNAHHWVLLFALRFHRFASAERCRCLCCSSSGWRSWDIVHWIGHRDLERAAECSIARRLKRFAGWRSEAIPRPQPGWQSHQLEA